MTRPSYNLTEPPTGRTYRGLIAFLFRHGTSCSVVLRREMPVSQSQQSFLDAALPFLLKRTVQSEWPGTRLLGGTAEVFTYHLAPEMERLFLAAQGLYDWQSPALPEDPAFYRADDSLLLGSIAHEADGFLELGAEEYETLRRTVPTLRIAAADAAPPDAL